MTVTLIDLGISNIESVARALDRIGVPWVLARSPGDVAVADRLILPGVGAFRSGMDSLRKTGMDRALSAAARNCTPILGICLGFQLLASIGEEGGMTPGLGLLPGRVVKLSVREGARVPNVGWCDVHSTAPSELFERTNENLRSYYFVHSYHVACDDAADVIAAFNFAGARHTAAARRGNVIGVQFHPEKSLDAGLTLLDRFCRGWAIAGAAA